MTPRHYVLTLTAAARQLSDVLPAADANPATPGVPATGLDRASKQYDVFHQIWLQADGGNGNPIRIGGDNTTSDTVWGISIPAAAATVPAPPIPIGPMLVGKLKLEMFWAFGTAGQTLHIFALEA